MVDRSFVITDSLSRKGEAHNIHSPVTMPAQSMDSPGSERDTMYCRAAHSCGESYREGKNTKSYKFAIHSTIHCHL